MTITAPAKSLYTHAMSIGFELAGCTCSTGEHYDAQAVRDAVVKRITEAHQDGYLIESVGLPDDTFDAGQTLNLVPAAHSQSTCTHLCTGKTYNHAYCFAFFVGDHADATGEVISHDELYAGAMAAVKAVDDAGAWSWIIGKPFGSYAEE